LGKGRLRSLISFGTELAETFELFQLLIDQCLCMILLELGIVVAHRSFVFPTVVVSLSHRLRVVGEVDVAVITVVLGHDERRG